MFRQASLVAGAVVLIAAFHPSACSAQDITPVQTQAPEKFEKFEVGEIDDMLPAELDADPTLEKPGGTKHSELRHHRGPGLAGEPPVF